VTHPSPRSHPSPLTHRSHPTVRATSAAFAALATLAACTALTGCSSDSPQDSAQDRIAEGFYSCLTDAGLPAQLDSFDGALHFDWPQTGYDIHANIPLAAMDLVGSSYSSVWHMIPGRSGDFEEFSERMAANFDPEEFILEIDGVDHSATYASCHDQHPYRPPDYEVDPAEELRGKQLVAESTNNWVSCARDHGLPDLVDVSPGKADNWLTSPTAEIPAHTTPELLRAVLAECPNFDAEQAERAEAPGFDESEYRPDPSISVADPADLSDQAALDRQAALRSVLDESMQQFYESRATQE
jgi:hypothetical protein